MIFTVPIVGKILAGFAASELGAAPAAQATDPQNASGAADAVDFAKAVDDLQAHCPTTVPPTTVARLDAVEARLDATWRSMLSIQVALANFESKLDDAQRDRLDQMNFVAER